MRTYLGHQVAVHIAPFEESTVGGGDDPCFGSDDFRTLFLGEPGETAAEAVMRADVAREVFAELMDDGTDDEITRLNGAYAAWLLCSASLHPARAHLGTRHVTGDVSEAGNASEASCVSRVGVASRLGAAA